MPANRYGKKRDGNERQIVDILRSAGYFVEQLDGKDIPDLLVCKWGRTVLVEVKDPANYGKLSEGQSRWHAMYQDFDGEVIVAEQVEDVLRYYEAKGSAA